MRPRAAASGDSTTSSDCAEADDGVWMGAAPAATAAFRTPGILRSPPRPTMTIIPTPRTRTALARRSAQLFAAADLGSNLREKLLALTLPRIDIARRIEQPRRHNPGTLLLQLKHPLLQQVRGSGVADEVLAEVSPRLALVDHQRRRGATRVVRRNPVSILPCVPAGIIDIRAEASRPTLGIPAHTRTRASGHAQSIGATSPASVNTFVIPTSSTCRHSSTTRVRAGFSHARR
jgi:hypothetical protein